MCRARSVAQENAFRKLSDKDGPRRGVYPNIFLACGYEGPSYFIRKHITRKQPQKGQRVDCRKYDGWLTILSAWHIKGWLNEPEGMWNTDWTAYQSEKLTRAMIATKGVKEVDAYTDGTNREVVAPLAFGNAFGGMLRPLILYKGTCRSNPGTRAQKMSVASGQIHQE